MIRVVALRKAAAAGLAGAVATEAFSFAASRAHLGAVDLVGQLSLVALGLPRAVALVAAAVAHVGVGVCWAVFYAFFFWGRLRLRPTLQGLIFAAIPAALTMLVVYPELALMQHPSGMVKIGRASCRERV